MYSKPFSIGLACLMTLFVITPIAHAQEKITGPWLWMIAPTEPGRGGADSIHIDSLAVVSGGAVTEADVAANGANEGDKVGNFVWTLGQISASGGNNINDCINRIGLAAGNVDDHTSYALFTLKSDTVRSNVTMRVGSDDAIKVWLNGEVVHNNPVDRGAFDFQDAFRVDLVAGDNLLMVKVSERGGGWSMFVGINSGGNTEDQGAGTTDLNVSEPLMVRLIYFLPNDRQPQPDIDAKLDALIKDVQQFYAEMMEKHGFGRQTFTLETDATGKAVVHHVNGKFNDGYYHYSVWTKVWGEIEEQFDMSNTIYLAALDISTENLGGSILDRFTCGIGSARGPGAGRALIPASGGCLGAAAHELGHAFGLKHDLRANPKLISSSYTSDWMITSFCAAEWLEAHRAFNPGISPLNRNTTIEMLSLSLASPLNTVRLRFKVTDPDGLHQAQLLTPDIVYSDGEFFGLIACKQLTGTSSVVEFVTTELTPKSDSVSLQVIDVHGNFSWNEKFPIDITSLLPPPEVVSIPDANLAAAVRGTPTTHTMLNLTRLEVPNRQITDLTGLEHALNLIWLNLGGEVEREGYVNSNAVSNFSPLLGLTQLRWLNLGGNSLTDISALAGINESDRAVSSEQLPYGHLSVGGVDKTEGAVS